jgi:hypothetical protein
VGKRRKTDDNKWSGKTGEKKKKERWMAVTIWRRADS